MALADYIGYAVCFGVGVAAAGANLVVLWYAAAALVRRKSFLPLLIGSVARFGLIAVLAVVAFQMQPSAGALLAAAVGFLGFRYVVLKIVGAPHARGFDEVRS